MKSQVVWQCEGLWMLSSDGGRDNPRMYCPGSFLFVKSYLRGGWIKEEASGWSCPRLLHFGRAYPWDVWDNSCGRIWMIVQGGLENLLDGERMYSYSTRILSNRKIYAQIEGRSFVMVYRKKGALNWLEHKTVSLFKLKSMSFATFDWESAFLKENYLKWSWLSGKFNR